MKFECMTQEEKDKYIAAINDVEEKFLVSS